tara:strand:+ start:508 stop:1896 length:1389 start_codon:yes stop_codon:yes gene_type:complete
MLPLGFVIFPFLIKFLIDVKSNKSFNKFFTYGFFYGLGLLIIYLIWIHNPFLVFEETRKFQILAFLFPAFLSVFFGFMFLIFKYLRSIFFFIIFTPFFFVITEFTISNFFYGFPWISFSLILSNNFFGLLLLKYFGIYTSSYIVIFLFILPTLLIYKNILKIKIKYYLILHLPFVIIIFYCLFFLTDQKNQIKELNIDVHQIFSPIKNINGELIQKNIINQIKDSKEDLIIYGENNYPFLVFNKEFTNLIENIEEKKVIIGATRKENNKFYNSLLYLEKNNFQYFDKKILVPFGEFLPLRNYLKFMEKISGTQDFQKGSVDRIIKTKNKINILPVICYEVIFLETFKKINEKEIDLIINITNDTWFGNKIGPYQHFYISRTRAALLNKPLVRVSNNGLSAIFDENGKIIKTTKLNQKNNFQYKLIITRNKSFYILHNILLIYVIFIFLILLSINLFFNHAKR